jgi:hypothetical protein
MLVGDDAVEFVIVDRGEIVATDKWISSLLCLPKSEGQEKSHKLWYRGLSDCSYQLTPTVGRKVDYANCRMSLGDEEKSLLHRFRRRAYPHVGRAMSAGEAIFLARHHGLPTRLLDWTANALFALYFACIEHPANHGRVWAMRRRPAPDVKELDAFDLVQHQTEEDLFEHLVSHNGKTRDTSDVIKIVYPLYNSPRLVAQDGAFTIHSEPTRSIESYEGRPFRRANLDIDRLYCWRVPKNKKTPILRELSSLGITQRLLFPDLDGLAKSLWQTEVLWNGTDVVKPGPVRRGRSL